MVECKIENVVGWVDYGRELDLAALGDTFRDREEVSDVVYEPAANHWLQTRFSPDSTYVAFYRSGSSSIAGANSVEHLENVTDRVVVLMKELLGEETEFDCGVSNIVASADLGRELPLEALAIELGFESIEYEPEQFPGLIYRRPDHVILLFASGKLICTGLSDPARINKAISDVAKRITVASTL